MRPCPLDAPEEYLVMHLCTRQEMYAKAKSFEITLVIHFWPWYEAPTRICLRNSLCGFEQDDSSNTTILKEAPELLVVAPGKGVELVILIITTVLTTWMHGS